MFKGREILPVVLTTVGLLVFGLIGGCGDGDDSASDGEWGGESGGGSGSNSNIPTPPPGQLTAGDWDDNLNIEWFLSFVDNLTSQQALPVPTTSDRVVITVVNSDGTPVFDARVQVSQNSTVVLEAPTATDGRLLFFPTRDGGSSGQAFAVQVSPPAEQPQVEPVHMTLSEDATEVTIVMPEAARLLPDALDLAFVVDTTGSMTDELSYLQTELQSIVDFVTEQAGPLSLRLALVVYRDHGDDYVTRTFDFTQTVSVFSAHLAQQSADGGGDYPEAVEEGLVELNGLSWRDGNVARVAFWIADAPSHGDDMPRVLDEIREARYGGIRIFPVAASGAADETEFLMRVAAQSTLARYLFLTDDSGIGDTHAEPHIPCYQVQYLNGLMSRMILSVLRGQHLPPEPDQILRSVGNPVDGICHVDDHPDAYL